MRNTNEQKEKPSKQHQLDMRQMVLLLHHRIGWQQWQLQKEEWWVTVKAWTRSLRASQDGDGRTTKQRGDGNRQRLLGHVHNGDTVRGNTNSNITTGEATENKTQVGMGRSET